MSLKWEDPPQGRKDYANWDEIRAELRKRPGKWARCQEYKTTATAYQVARKLTEKHPSAYKFVGRTDPKTGQGVVHGRYIGRTK